MPQWGWSFGPGAHAWSHAWQVLLALYGCSGEGAHREVSPMFSFQSQTAKSTSWKYHGHSSLGVGPSWLPVPGTWERPGRKCSGDHRPFHQVCSGICYKDPDSTNNGEDPMGQIYCPLWSPWKDSNWSRMKFWESVGGWPLWVDGSTEDTDQSVPSTDQWSMWKVQILLSLPREFLITGTYSLSVNSYVFVFRMFVTSILKLGNLLYLPGHSSWMKAFLGLVCFVSVALMGWI